jgi:hypothetical protein
MESFKLFGYVPAMERRAKVIEVCRMKGWEFLCMAGSGKRYVIKVGCYKLYWTFKEVITNADLKGSEADGANRLDSVSSSGNRLLANRSNDKVPMARRSRSI